MGRRHSCPRAAGSSVTWQGDAKDNFWGTTTRDGGKSTSTSSLLPVFALAKAITQQLGLGNIPTCLIEQLLPCLKDTAVEIKYVRRTPGEGISNLTPHSESPSPPNTVMPATKVPGLFPAVPLPGSLPLIVQPEQPPLVEQPQFGGWYSTMSVPEWEVPTTGLPTVEAPTVPYEPEQPQQAC